jgi:hypothetical protein
MHRKAVFLLAAVFLTVALVVPPTLLILQSDKDLDNIINAQNPVGHDTSGNVTLTDEMGETHQTTYLIVFIVEVIFVILFAVTIYYGINHTNPKH